MNRRQDNIFWVPGAKPAAPRRWGFSRKESKRRPWKAPQYEALCCWRYYEKFILTEFVDHSEFRIRNEHFDILQAEILEQANHAGEIQTRRIYSRDCNGFEAPVRHHFD